MRPSTPTPWYRKAPIRGALAALLIALVALTATSAVYAVAYVDPDTPPGGSDLPNAIYGYPYPPSGGPVRLVATGTNAGTQFFIVNPPPSGYNPPLGTRLPNGIQIIQDSQTQARIATPPGGTVTEPATDDPNGITFAIGVTGNANEPPGSGTVAARGYRIRVQRAPLTVTANNATRRYGAPNPTFTFNVTGLRNGDTVQQVFAGALATTATSASPAGTYQIIQGTLGLTNYGAARYTLNFEPGTLTVTRAPLTVTANDATRRVGAPNPTFTARYEGFVNGDGPADLNGTLSFSTPATTASPAGTYPITPGGLTSNNYAITFVDGTLTVTERDLPEIAWPDPAPITYGTPLSSAQLNATASFNGQTVPGVFTYDPPAGTVLPAGTRNLRVTFTPNDTTNFAPVSVDRTITVNRAPLRVVADNRSRTYGAANPSLTYTANLQGNDTLAQVLTGSPATPATATSPVGAYPINQGTLALSEYGAERYTLTFEPGTLSVTPAPLTIRANDVSRPFGRPNPPFTASYIGFVNDEGPGVLQGELRFTTTATESSPMGTYPIVPSGLSSPNYNITYVPGTLTISDTRVYLPLLVRN
ncbi:MAG: MBG domain-containing protein [Oscillochloridaceae bacterium]|nr:hypothetical protein [Chloroflexaceae bacterium]MDW8388962.1 MBG domain-containing protein [Oscillochloridaceae bacterium]